MLVGVSYAQSEWVFCKRTEFTGVALHLGVFQGIVKSSGKHYSKVYHKFVVTTFTEIIDRLIQQG
jgi:hypothetical protein